LPDGVRDSWISRAESVFNQCISHPGVFAFLLDQWSHMLEAHQQHSPAAAAGAAAQAGGDAGGPSAPVLIPAPMLDWMHEKVNVSTQGTQAVNDNRHEHATFSASGLMVTSVPASAALVVLSVLLC
jgi:hypothetical protein